MRPRFSRLRLLLGFLPLALAGCAPSPSLDLSPDGKTLAVPGEAGIACRSTSGTGTVILPETENAAFPKWSPDGRQLLFRMEERVAYYDFAERRTQQLAGELGPPFAWRPDSTQVAGFTSTEEGSTELRVLNFPGGDIETRVSLPFDSLVGEGTPLWLAPGALAVVGTEAGKSNLYLVEGGQVRQITHSNDVIAAGRGPVPGSVLWARRLLSQPDGGIRVWSGDLRAGTAAPCASSVRLPGLSGRAAGEGVQVEGVRFSPRGTHLALVAAVRGRGVVYVGSLHGPFHLLQSAERIAATDSDDPEQPRWETLEVFWSGSGETAAVRSAGERDRVRFYSPEGRLSGTVDLPAE